MEFQVKERSAYIYNNMNFSIEEFAVYMNYCRGLRFEEKPDYNYIKKLFRDLFFKHYDQWDFIYDWHDSNVFYFLSKRKK